MASTRLTRTTGSPTLNTKYTLSCWIKRAKLSYSECFLFDGREDANNRFKLVFNANDHMECFNSHGGSDTFAFVTNRRFRDVNGWYNIVLAVDTTDGTSGDRFKVYVNGIRETSFSSSTTPSQNDANNVFNEASRTIGVGSYWNGSSYTNYFEGCMSHVHFCDGTALAPTIFGSTDSTTGEWKIETSPSFTLGNNGFTILKDANTITDQSSNSNDFSLSAGTLTKTEDCPSNVFATYNPLDNYFASSTFSNGNTTIVTNSTNTTYNTSTLGIPPTMKCYWEAKFDTIQSANGEVGIVNTPTTGSAAGAGASRLYYQPYGISVNDLGVIWSANANTGITLGTLATSDIVCFAWDGVNQALYVRKNGDAWINSGDPTSGASKTGAVKSFSGTRTMFPAVGDQSGSHAVGSSTNFGNGYFGTTVISSEGTNASGIGKFEYDVPTGYTALSTKGLNL